MSSAIVNFPLITFKKHKPNYQANSNANIGFKVIPLLVDFRQLLRTPDYHSQETIPGIPNMELLHAVATLYGVSLSEVTNDIIYPILSEKCSKTLLMILDEEQAGEHVRESLTKLSNKKVNANTTSSHHHGHHHHIHHKRSQNDEKIHEKINDDRFVNIFSDDENSSDDGNQSDDETDLSSGIDDFLHSVDERKKAQEQWLKAHHSNIFIGSDSEVKGLPLGIENRLIACATFECSLKKPSEKVLLINLLAVRRKYRSIGIGSFIIKQLLNPSITGGSDVIVVNADPNAAEFFEKHGFTDDVILNSRFGHVGDLWFNCKRMCYLQGYTKGNISNSLGENYYSLHEMEMEINQWKETSAQSYQSYATIFQRMKNEIMNLKSHVVAKGNTISRLQHELAVKSSQMLRIQEDSLSKSSLQSQPSLSTVEKKSYTTYAMDSIPNDLTIEIFSSNKATTSKLPSFKLTPSQDFAILSQFLLDSLKFDQIPSSTHQFRRGSVNQSRNMLKNASPTMTSGHASLPNIDVNNTQQSFEKLSIFNQSSEHGSSHCLNHNAQTSSMQVTNQFNPHSKTSFVKHSPTNDRLDNIVPDGFTSHSAIASGLHNATSGKSLASKVPSAEVTNQFNPHSKTSFIKHSPTNDRLDNIVPDGFTSHSAIASGLHNATSGKSLASKVSSAEVTNQFNPHSKTSFIKHSPTNDRLDNIVPDGFTSHSAIASGLHNATSGKSLASKVSSAEVTNQFNPHSKTSFIKHSPTNDRLDNIVPDGFTSHSAIASGLHNATSGKSLASKVSSAEVTNQFNPHSKTSFVKHSPTNDRLDNIVPDGFTSHSAIASGLHNATSGKSLASKVPSAEVATFVEESKDNLCNFMQKSTDEFLKFAQKSHEEFSNFSKVSADFRELFVLEMKHCFLDSITYHGGTLPCDKTEVIDVVVAELPDKVTSQFSHAVTHSHDSDIVVNLYFCGGEHHRSNSDSFDRIIRNGFAFEDFVESEFGKGLHFSQHANSATYFSPSGNVLVAQVCLGRNQTIISKDSRRKQAPEGFDSILTQGRLSDSRYNLSSYGDTDCSEYMIFDPNLALPLAIIKYEVMY